MSKITIEFKNRKVEYYNVPYALARAIQTVLHHIEMDSDSDVVSGETEFDEDDSNKLTI